MTPNFDRADRALAYLLAPLCIAAVIAARGLPAARQALRDSLERARKAHGSLVVVPDRRALR